MCAITGSGETVGRSPHVPVTPEQIATSAIEAAEAGAAVVHIHVRDPQTGRGARDPHLYKEVVDRVRSSGVDVVLNLTAGMGGDMVLGGHETPLPLDDEGTDMAGATERLAHVELLMPFLESVQLESRPEEIVERPEIVAFLDQIAAPLPSPAGPTRQELLRLVA